MTSSSIPATVALVPVGLYSCSTDLFYVWASFQWPFTPTLPDNGWYPCSWAFCHWYRNIETKYLRVPRIFEGHIFLWLSVMVSEHFTPLWYWEYTPGAGGLWATLVRFLTIYTQSGTYADVHVVRPVRLTSEYTLSLLNWPWESQKSWLGTNASTSRDFR